MARLRILRDRLLSKLRREIPELVVYGSMQHRVASNLNVSFGSIRGDSFLSAVPKLALSGGAACASGKAQGSHVLAALGADQEEANRAVRIGLGRMTTHEDTDRAGQLLVDAARRLLETDGRGTIAPRMSVE
jgi:cysteine desulfurase